MIERLTYEGTELRSIRSTDGTRTIEGLIPYNSRSADLGNFTEQIAPGAFAAALKPNADVLCLRDHDQKILLGRTKARTMTLTDSAAGLRYRVDLPQTTQASDLAESTDRGDVDGCSFGFTCAPGGDEWGRSGDGKALRTLRSVELFEISPCSFPAYAASNVSLRSCPPAVLRTLSVRAKPVASLHLVPARRSRLHGKALREWREGVELQLEVARRMRGSCA